MEISQGNLARLVLGSLLLGFLTASAKDVFRYLIAAVILPVDSTGLSSRVLRIYRAVMPESCESRVKGGTKRNRCCRILKRIIGVIFRFLYDVLWAVVFAVLLLLLLYTVNDGRFRLSAVVVMLAGVLLYQIALKKGICRVSGAISALTQALLVRVLYISSWPFRCVWKWTGRPRHWLGSRFVHLSRCAKRKICGIRQRAANRKIKNNRPESDRLSALREQPNGKNVYVSGKRPLK